MEFCFIVILKNLLVNLLLVFKLIFTKKASLLFWVIIRVIGVLLKLLFLFNIRLISLLPLLEAHKGRQRVIGAQTPHCIFSVVTLKIGIKCWILNRYILIFNLLQLLGYLIFCLKLWLWFYVIIKVFEKILIHWSQWDLNWCIFVKGLGVFF